MQPLRRLTDSHLLLMLDICTEAQDRAERRLAYARNTGDLRTVAYELQLQEQYANLRQRLLDELNGSPARDPLLDTLNRIALDPGSGKPGENERQVPPVSG